MKMLFIVLGLLLGSLTTPATFATDTAFTISPATATFEAVSTDKDVLAAAGCCKHRKSTDSPWRKIHSDFDRCKKKNDEIDKDNVFKPSKLYWWDAAC